jgi:tetratricopeptide (TPR) repeat protein
MAALRHSRIDASGPYPYQPRAVRERPGGGRDDRRAQLNRPTSETEVEAAYRALEKRAARVFRLLPVNPGPDVSAAVAAVLTDLPVSQALWLLADLTRAGLIAAAAGHPRRWRLQDPARQYAQQLSGKQAEADGREQALDRLLGYYMTMADAADDQLRALPGTPLPEEFASRADALAWLDSERDNLIAVVQMAAESGREQVAMSLPLLMAQYLSWRRRFDDLLAVMTVSLAAARRLGDRDGEGDALTNLGLVLRELHRFDEAIASHQHAVAIFRGTDDCQGEGDALDNLGLALSGMRRFDEAVAAYRDAVAIYQKIGDRRGEGNALNNFGLAMRGLRRFDEAVAAHRDAVAIYQKIGDRHGEGNALGNQGLSLRDWGRSAEAINALHGAAVIFRETGDRHAQGVAWNNLAAVQQDVGHFGEAVTAYERAALIFRDTGDRDREVSALEGLARARAGAPLT